MLSPDDLLERVVDKQTFIEFVQALAEERARAQEIEARHPNAYMTDSALGWQNDDISSFLSAALECFIAQPITYLEQNPSWKMFAEFLYFGKIYE